MATSRRSILITLAVIGGAYFGLRYGPSAIDRFFAQEFEFEAMDRPSGFRRIFAGETSSGYDPFVGLDAGNSVRQRNLEAQVESNLCEALFPDWKKGSAKVPVASFSDYNCPFCRVLTKRLAARVETQEVPIAVSWHELPLLGQSSRDAARGALAAKRQGAYAAFHLRLMRSRFATTPAYLRRLAIDLDIDAEKLIADMNDPSISEEIEMSAAVSRVFGFIGTPALVVGRTVVQGEISEHNLDRLLEIELQSGPPDTC